MSRQKEKLVRSYVGELPIIRHIVDQLGLKEKLSQHIKPHGNELVPAVDTLMILLYNITCGRKPLYELQEWVDKTDLTVFPDMPHIEKGSMNDDRFGRALDKLYQADRASLMTDIVMDMVASTGLSLTRIHNDSTTIKAYGEIPGITRTGLQLTRGNSKDHRPDLKQLVYSLTISSDGAVPVHYKAYSGNRTDDTTHIETWNTLRKITGRPDFLYVADCKVCTAQQLAHITSHGGRVVTIIPETWSEVKQFKNLLRKKKKPKTIISRKEIPGKEHQFEYFSAYKGLYYTHEGHFRIHWIFSSEKKKRDKKNRENVLRKTEHDLAALNGKLNTRKLKSKQNIQKRLELILKQHGTQRYYHTEISTMSEADYVQCGRGRPGPNTEFKTVHKTIYALTYVRDQKALQEEQNLDGLFPLLTTDETLDAKETLAAYKYQPRLEKRFTQFKSVHKGAPLLFKSIQRIEAIMFLFFLALMIQAVLERTVRNTMHIKKIDSLPIYPEHRIAYHPTTAKIFERFEGVSVSRLVLDQKEILIRDELTELQKVLLDIIGISESAYWT